MILKRAMQKERNEIGELLIKIKGGDESAFSNLVKLMTTDMKNVAYSVLRNNEDAEDAVQESYLNILHYLGYYRYNKNAYAWIMKITYNKSLEILRKRKRRRETDFIETPAEEVISGLDDKVFVERILQALTPSELKLIVLRYWADMTIRQISAATHRPSSTTHRALKKTEQKLRVIIDGEQCENIAVSVKTVAF